MYSTKGLIKVSRMVFVQIIIICCVLFPLYLMPSASEVHSKKNDDGSGVVEAVKVVIELVKLVDKIIQTQSSDCRVAGASATWGTDVPLSKRTCEDQGYLSAVCTTQVWKPSGYAYARPYAEEDLFGKWYEFKLDPYVLAVPFKVEGKQNYAAAVAKARVDNTSKGAQEGPVLRKASTVLDTIWLQRTIMIDSLILSVTELNDTAFSTVCVVFDEDTIFKSRIVLFGDGQVQTSGDIPFWNIDVDSISEGGWKASVYSITQTDTVSVELDSLFSVTGEAECRVAGQRFSSLPTLTNWGFLILILAITGFSVYMLMRRRKVSAV